jgi:hypothetical protein
MKVDYDSEGKSLLFELVGTAEDDTDDVAGGTCLVGHREGRAVWIQLLGADEDISPLDEAAERFDLDAEGLRAAARAALAAPDREINIEVGKRLPLSNGVEAEEARAA